MENGSVNMVIKYNSERLLKLYGNPSGYKIENGTIKYQLLEQSERMSNIEFIERITRLPGSEAVADFQRRILKNIQVLDGKELLNKEFPPMEYLADGLIATGTSFLCGDPKVGKSLTALQLAQCVAGGQSMFGKFPARVRGKVLFFYLEDGQKRLNLRMKGLGFDDKTASDMLIVTDAPKLGSGFEEQLEALLFANPDVRLVIIDPLVQIRPVTGGNNPYREDYAAIQSVRTIFEDHCVSGLIVHHLRKEQGTGDISPLARISGTQGLSGAVDHIFIMSGVRGKRAATVHRISRDDEELSIGLQQDGIRWNYAGSDVSVMLSEAKRPVYECVAASPEPLGPTEIARVVGKSKGTVSEHCKALVAEGKFEEFDGKYSLAA